MFKTDPNAPEYTAATEDFDKKPFMIAGSMTSSSAISPSNAIIFGTPILATRVRIELKQPLRSGRFGISKVRFWKKRNIVIVKNINVEPSTNYCFFVNTNIPRQDSLVEAYDCVKAVSVGKNQELMIMNTDSTVRLFNNEGLCIWFSPAQQLVLRDCGPRAQYIIYPRTDGTLYFNGYQDNSIFIDDTQTTSPNFINDRTTFIVTSQADSQTFKKENIRRKI